MDHFAVGGWRQVTGIDMQDLVPQLSPVLGRSIAQRWGSRKLWDELYLAGAEAGTGEYVGAWDLRVGQLRQALLHAALQGVTRFILHGYYLTDGHFDAQCRPFDNLRYDFPPGFNFLPWFETLGPGLLGELAEVQDVLATTGRECAVELVYPLRSIWRYGRSCAAARTFSALAEALDGAGGDFWIVPEDDSRGLLRLEPSDERESVLVTGGDGGPGVLVDLSEALGRARDAGRSLVQADCAVPSYRGGSAAGQVFVCHNARDQAVQVSVPTAGVGRARLLGGFTGRRELTDVVLDAGVQVEPGETLILDWPAPARPTMAEVRPETVGVALAGVRPEGASKPGASLRGSGVALAPQRTRPSQGTLPDDERIPPPTRHFRVPLTTSKAATAHVELPASKDAYEVLLDGVRVGVAYEGGRTLTVDLPVPLRDANLEIIAYGGSERAYYGNTRHAGAFVSEWRGLSPRMWLTSDDE